MRGDWHNSWYHPILEMIDKGDHGATHVNCLRPTLDGIPHTESLSNKKINMPEMIFDI